MTLFNFPDMIFNDKKKCPVTLNKNKKTLSNIRVGIKEKILFCEENFDNFSF